MGKPGRVCIGDKRFGYYATRIIREFNRLLNETTEDSVQVDVLARGPSKTSKAVDAITITKRMLDRTERTHVDVSKARQMSYRLGEIKLTRAHPEDRKYETFLEFDGQLFLFRQDLTQDQIEGYHEIRNLNENPWPYGEDSIYIAWRNEYPVIAKIRHFVETKPKFNLIAEGDMIKYMLEILTNLSARYSRLNFSIEIGLKKRGKKRYLESGMKKEFYLSGMRVTLTNI